MGYETQFKGQIKVTPPLNAAEVTWVNQMSKTRQCLSNDYWQTADDVSDTKTLVTQSHNTHHKGKPTSFWVGWRASSDGTHLYAEDGKNYEPTAWLRWLCNVFTHANTTPGRPEFISKHRFDGEVVAIGEEFGDWSQIVCVDSDVTEVPLFLAKEIR